MSGILRRTIFMTTIPYEPGKKEGAEVFRFEDAASVVTGIGGCVEPFTIHDIRGISTPMPLSNDPKDMMRRIDVVLGVPGDLYRDGDLTIHAYDQWLRVGP